MKGNTPAKNALLGNARVLIAGGQGFIGTRLTIHLLKEAREVIVLTKRTSSASAGHYLTLDLASPRAVPAIRALGTFDYVFNLIGVTEQEMPHPHPEQLLASNLLPLIHLTRGIAWEHVRGAVHVGSNAEYGNQPVPHNEDMMSRPTNAYGWAKASTTSYALMMTDAGFAKWCVARPFFVYGPGQTRGLVADAFADLQKGKLFVLKNGSSTRDPVFVADVAEGLIRLAVRQEAQGQIVNICCGSEIRTDRIVRLIQKQIKYGTIVVGERSRQGDILRSSGTPARLKKITQWKPNTSLEEGIRLTCQSLVRG